MTRVAAIAALIGGCLFAWSSAATAQTAPASAGIPCATAETQQPPPIPLSSAELHSRYRGFPRVGSFDIVLNAGAGLSGNADALAAFERAAEQWEALFSDPITITIDADLADLGDPNVIGSTLPTAYGLSYEDAATVLASDADDESDDDIVASLPAVADFDAAMSASFTLSGNVVLTQANLKALGLTFAPSDASITFNTDFASAFDYDNSDGVAVTDIDFESIAAHEIGHALGFTSMISTEDVNVHNGTSTGNVSPAAMDLFRFHDATADDPASATDFSTFTRSMTFNTADVTDDIDNEWPMSTGTYNGDGRQPSHWKDDALSGSHIGMMDPSYNPGAILTLTEADRRLLDLIGYDYDICGNTVIDAGETCDDGNHNDFDCCSKECQLDALTAPCIGSSGECTVGECDGAGACVDQEGPIDEAQCLGAPATKLQLTLNADPTKNKLAWQWNKGDGYDQTALFDPLFDAVYTLCVFDTSAGIPSVATSLQILPSASLWKNQAHNKGSKYKDRTGSSDGVTSAQFKTGVAGKTKAKLTAKGMAVPMPLPFGATFFEEDPSVIVQLHNSGGTCWTSSFGAADTRKNTATQFSAQTK